jgi:hypothetical protein
MTRYLLQTILAVTVCAALSPIYAEVSCARCKKIEAERTREQAEHPQPVGYYDEQANLQQKEKSLEKTSS